MLCITDGFNSNSSSSTGKAGAIIFGHAFVQPSYSYINVINKLKRDGWLVLAPSTDLFDMIGRDVGLKFDQKRADVKLQSTLQVKLVNIPRTHAHNQKHLGQ